jgi:hypothetical protein
MAKSKGANIGSNMKRSAPHASAPSAKQRKSMPASNFAGPGKSYPIVNNKGQKSAPIARNALARAAQFASPAVQAQVKRKVAANFPSIAVTGKRSGSAGRRTAPKRMSSTGSYRRGK